MKTPVDTMRSKSRSRVGNSSIGSSRGSRLFQPVFLLKILLMIQRRLADIDPYYFRLGVPVRKNRGLVCATTRNKNIEIRFVFAIRP